MEKIDYRKEIPLWAIMLIPVAYICYVWGSLPDSVPIHFDIHGEANDWGSKWMIFLMPAISLGTYLMLLFVRNIDPKRMKDEAQSNVFYKIRMVLVLFMSFIGIVITFATVHGNMEHGISRFLFAGIFLLFAVLGNFMINIKPNWFIGVRTPWTLSSDNVWRKTHQVTGKMWFYGGLICCALSMFVSDEWDAALILVFALGSASFAFGYSFWLFKKETAV